MVRAETTASGSPHLDIDCRDIANNVVLIVDHGKGSDALLIHEFKGFPEESVTTAPYCQYL